MAYNGALDALYGALLIPCLVLGIPGNALSLSYFLRKRHKTPGSNSVTYIVTVCFYKFIKLLLI